MTMEPAYDKRLEFDLPDRLRRSLRVADVGVGEMADYLGVGRSSVGNWINGRVTPDKRTLRLFALRTGVPLSWIETGVIPASPDPEDGSRLSESNRRPIHYE